MRSSALIVPVRGSSSRGGARALLQMVREVRRTGGVVGHVVDGPLGPPGEVEPGVILLAQRSGAAIVPVYFSAQRCWRMRSWDRMELPKPFSPIRLCFGPAQIVPRELSEDDAEKLRLELEQEMALQYARLDTGREA